MNTPNNLRTIAGVRFAVGIFLTVLGAVMISRGADALAALPLAFAVVHFVWGSRQLTIARHNGALGR
jgi:hypothetical protein